MARLCAGSLIEWDPEEELVRIVGLHRQRPPENASRSIDLITDFNELLRRYESAQGQILRASAEFAVPSFETFLAKPRQEALTGA